MQPLELPPIFPFISTIYNIYVFILSLTSMFFLMYNYFIHVSNVILMNMITYVFSYLKTLTIVAIQNVLIGCLCKFAWDCQSTIIKLVIN